MQDQIIGKYKELVKLLFQFHDLYRSNVKIGMSYEQWREKVIILQTEIKMLENAIQ
jgi:hypothetical protein